MLSSNVALDELNFACRLTPDNLLVISDEIHCDLILDEDKLQLIMKDGKIYKSML